MAQLWEDFWSAAEMSKFQSGTRGNLNICSQKWIQYYTKFIKIFGKSNDTNKIFFKQS